MFDSEAYIPTKVVWSDENMITNNDIFNRHNTNYCSEQNPCVKRSSPTLNVRAVRQCLCEQLPRKLIAAHSDTSWLARSPDLTPLDSFL